MLKRKKDKKLKKKSERENKSEEKCGNSLAEEISKSVSDEIRENSSENIDNKDDFKKSLKELLKDLYYISETDAEFSVFIGEKAESVSKEEILRQTNNAPYEKVEERNFTEFFERLTKIQDWFEEKETENARKFGEVKKLLEENLTNLKVFKIGDVQIDIYIVGLDLESRLSGIKTEAVET